MIKTSAELSKNKRYFMDERCKSQSIRNKTECVLKWISACEADWEDDYANMPLSDVQNAIDGFISSRTQDAEAIVFILREYVRWRKDHGLSYNEELFSIKANIEIAMKRRMVSSPAHLARIMSIAFPDREGGECIYSSFLWMGFIGLDEHEAACVCTEHVDFNNMVIRFNGRTYPICSEAVMDLKAACNLDTFVGSYIKDGNVYKKRYVRSPGNEIIRQRASKRGVKPSKVIASTYRGYISKRFIETDEANRAKERPLPLSFDMSFDRIYLSGVFCRMYDLERMGDPVDFSAEAKLSVTRNIENGMKYTISKTSNLETVARKKVLNLELDYGYWKSAFFNDTSGIVVRRKNNVRRKKFGNEDEQ